MTQDTSSPPVATPTPSFPFVLVLRWLLGVYLIGGSLFAAATIISNWSAVDSTFQGVQRTEPLFSIYPLVLAWLLKLTTGVLLLLRSRWLLVSIPAWIVVFLWHFFSYNKFDQLPPQFFFSIVIQLVVLSFACWLHGRKRLR